MKIEDSKMLLTGNVIRVQDNCMMVVPGDSAEASQSALKKRACCGFPDVAHVGLGAILNYYIGYGP